MTVLFVASIHEFGAPDAGIPERSFVRAYVDENRAQIEAWQYALGLRALSGEITAKQALNQLGALIAGGMQDRIARGIAPPNTVETIMRKGSGKPLIDTGQLRSSITWKVRRKGEA